MGKDQEFLEAARNGNIVIVEKLLNTKFKRGGPLASLRRGPGSNIQDASGYSALHHAALNGHRDIVALLLEHEASPNLPDSKGSTPLHLAAWAGHSDIVRLLLTSGVRITQINLRNKDNETALHCAAQYGHTGIVNLLLSAGADPSYRNIREETALDLAAQYGRLETVELLLETHRELIESYQPALVGNPRPKTTPLHAASRNGHRAVVDALLSAGFPVSYTCQTGTALHEAALCGKVDVVRRLLEAGIDVSLKDSRGVSALRLVQDLPTPVAQDIATLIQNSALLEPGRNGCQDANYPKTSSSSSSAFSPGSTYENVSLASSKDLHGRSGSSSITDSFITLPRRRHKPSSSARQSEREETYEVPPPPRSLPWFQQQQQQQRRTEGPSSRTEKSSSHSDLLDDCDQPYLDGENGGAEAMSRSFDARSLGFLSDANSSSTTAARSSASDGRSSAFSRSSRSRHSADQYLPMMASSTTRISPNPPQKPPRKIQGMSAHYESLPRNMGRPKMRQTAFPSVRPSQPSKKDQTPAAGGKYEMVYLARTGTTAAEEGEQPSTSPRFRVGSTGSSYVEMAQRQLSSYENVFPIVTASGPPSGTVDDESIYDLPRELGGSKYYENVSFNRTMSSSSTTSSTPPSTSKTSTTPESPSRIAANLPPTPDHPPPPAHMAEQSIHLRMRPLSEELKRTSRDIETETEEELFLVVSSTTIGQDSSGVNGESFSATSLSTSSSSDTSTDNNEEVLHTSETPYEGKPPLPGRPCFPHPPPSSPSSNSV